MSIYPAMKSVRMNSRVQWNCIACDMLPLRANLDLELIMKRHTYKDFIFSQTRFMIFFQAYRRWVQEKGEEEPKLPGLNLTHAQLFFVGFAQVRRPFIDICLVSGRLFKKGGQKRSSRGLSASRTWITVFAPFKSRTHSNEQNDKFSALSH